MTFMDSPARADVRIAGRGFRVDTDSDVPQWSHQTIPLLRRQFDSSAEAGETTLNPEGPWRRTIDTWHRGAGQVDQDGTDSRYGQFKDSRRVDVWTKGQVSALPVRQLTAERATYMASSPSGLYSLDDASRTITRRLNGAVTSVVMSPVDGVALDITSDGESVWVVIFGGAAPGLYRYNADLTGEAHCHSATATLSGCEWTGDRLMVWTISAMYDMSTISYAATPQPAPTALLTLNLPNQGWRSVTWGQGYIYMASGGGHIYKTSVKPDGTALDVPVIAAELPGGEIPKTIYGYLGFVLIATSRGYRLSIPDAEGNLTLGGTIEVGGGITDTGEMIGRGRFVYTPVAGTAPEGGGVYSFDLSILNDTVPGYAAHLWAGGTPTTMHSIGFDGDDLYFGTTANVYYADSVNAPDGWVETGEIDFGLSSAKVAKGITADVASGAVTFTIYDDVGTAYPVGVATPETDTLSIPTDITSRSFRVRAVLSADAVLRSYTLLAFPTGVHTDLIQVPVVLGEHHHYPQGDLVGSGQSLIEQNSELSVNVDRELAFLRSLRDVGNFIDYYEGEQQYTVQVVAVDYLARSLTKDRRATRGTAVVTMKTSGVLGTEASATVPGQVVAVVVTSGDTQLLVGWDAPFDGGDDLTDYEVRYSSNSGSTWTEVSAGLNLTETLTGLVNGTEYLVGVRAVNSIGDGAWSVSTAGTPAGLPDAPTGLAVVG